MNTASKVANWIENYFIFLDLNILRILYKDLAIVSHFVVLL